VTTLDIFVPGRPRTKGSWRPITRANGSVFMKPSTDEKPWAIAVAYEARQGVKKLVSKPNAVTVELSFNFATPKKATNTFPQGDVDKLARSCLDALTGICWQDDVQVSDLRVTKTYGGDEGVLILVKEAP
jgi:crossover junction endodeoxyribonuclease RusA